jgi:hypothetical protein
MYMFAVRHKLSFALAGLVGLCAMPAVRANMIHEPNNSPAAAFSLPGGQLVVSDDLNEYKGRPDTILGHYDPAYSTLLDENDDAPGVGNGFASQLLDVPLRTNGSAYFSVTGAPDSAFAGAHAQFGKYSITYDVFSPTHVPVKSLTELEWVTPGMVDNMWLDPDESLSNWTGYTVDVTVNNLVGPDSGDSLDFFLFTGMQPFVPFTARLTSVQFDAIIGLFDGLNNLVATGELVNGVLTLEGITDGLGRVKIGVTGLGDDDFLGEHSQVGMYTLEIEPVLVPEPGSAVLLATGAALVGLLGRRRRRGCRKRRAVRGS